MLERFKSNERVDSVVRDISKAFILSEYEELGTRTIGLGWKEKKLRFDQIRRMKGEDSNFRIIVHLFYTVSM